MNASEYYGNLIFEDGRNIDQLKIKEIREYEFSEDIAYRVRFYYLGHLIECTRFWDGDEKFEDLGPVTYTDVVLEMRHLDLYKKEEEKDMRKENKYSTDTSDDIEICEIQHVESDKVNHPNHYNQNGMEVWDVIKAFTSNLSGAEAFYAGNAIKYILRWDKKNGIEDLEKAKVYINKIIEGRKEK